MKQNDCKRRRVASPKFLRAGQLWRMYGRAKSGLSAIQALVHCEELPLKLRRDLEFRVRVLEFDLEDVCNALPHNKEKEPKS